MKKLLSFLLALLLMIIGSFFWWNNAHRPVNPGDKTTKIFVVPKGQGISQISQKLKREGLIKSSLAFQILVVKAGLLGKIQAGDFRLSPSMDLTQIMTLLQHGSLDIWVTLPEGWRNEEIAEALQEKLGIPTGEFLRLAREGYLFPDTYLFPKEATAAAVVNIMRANFEQRFDSSLRQEAQKKGFSTEQVVILASMVEREAKDENDRPLVAGILRKRLNEEMPLQVDATVQYVIANLRCQNPKVKCGWWPKKLTKEDLKINSPYNTYLNPGLPPTPIANPGLAAIKAVIYPQDSDFWYYLSDRQGQMHYAKTLAEHNKNIEKYLR